MKERKKRPQKVYIIDGDKMKFRYHWATRRGGNGFGLSLEEVMYTLNTIDQHMVGIVYEKRESEEGK